MENNPGCTISLGGWGSTLLTILFVLLKVTEHIDWSWWWVFSPLWIPSAIFIIVYILIFIVYILALIYKSLS